MKNAGKGDPGREEMIREITDLAGSIDEEGLLFLIDQANVLLYNQRVDELNTRRKKLKALREESRGDLTETPEPPADIEVVEKEGGKHFYIVIGGFRIYFTREEMRALVKICHATGGDRAEGGRRLYTWFSRKRSDLLHDGQVGGGGDPRLAKLWEHLVSTYRARE